MLVSGVDDGYFPLEYKKGKGKCPLVSVTYNNYSLVDVDFDMILVDGKDGSEKFRKLRKGDIIIFDSIIVGGFNYIEPDKNYIIFYSSKPNLDRILHAAIKHYNDERVNVIKKYLSNMIEISTKYGSVYINTDLDIKLAKNIIEYYQVFSKIPEPIKTAHIIGKSIGQSHIISD
ncbi:DUF99 family protein [Acidianus sulfidivorans JP7]|uniref:UPF0215 protein DFR86_06405 n=1 Tax=Acidianus sulfidivorans JP7 TaxID=619593 RepID=A0A2U9IQF8_9CREN|nr:DUF99 family protein [Acidianus sulfidivorans]AWR98262.1 DUF99 family protein [Acidianus sulfidivorans JP7]